MTQTDIQKITLTSESVGAGHPDKICDIVSDSILDALLTEDCKSRVAVETWVKDNTLGIIGEVTTNADINFEKIARDCVRDIGYTDAEWGMNFADFEFVKHIGAQSQEIAQGVNEEEGVDHEQGAGDQGLMWGYATNETPELMPLPIILSHRLVEKVAELKGEHTFLRPDCKSQVSIEYKDDKPSHVTTVVLAVQHDETISEEDLETFVIENIINPVCQDWLTDDTKCIVNGTGKFIVGGPKGDAGLTGRKIIVDTYGGLAKHGGGAFSGKDPSKVDRSAAYFARYIAKNLVAAKLCEKCEVQLSYCIGVSRPTSFFVNTFGTGTLSDEQLAEIAQTVFGLTPKSIIEHLNLLKPDNWSYAQTASYGHFGRDIFPWEKTNLVEELLDAAKRY